MNQSEYNQILEYLHIAEQSKYRYEDIQARFQAEAAATYGENMARWLPDYEYAHQLLLDSIAVHVPDHAVVVELGAGNGRFSRLLLEAILGIQLSLVDLSPNLLNTAQARLATRADQCQFILHDIFDPSLEFPANSVDCVVSVFAICHAQAVSVYQGLYERIHRWLKPGGYFACYDHVRGDTPALTALNAMGWHRLLLTNQTAEQAKEGILGTYQEDSPLSLRQHLGLLSAAGFSSVDVLYKRDIFGIYVAVK